MKKSSKAKSESVALADTEAALAAGPAAQIAAMRTLSPNAAAWLLSLEPRSVRDKVEIPRNADGTYDGRTIVEWATTRGKTPELTNAQYEICLQLAEQLDEITIGAILKPLRAVVRSIGGNRSLALAAVCELILRDTEERVGRYPEEYDLADAEIDAVHVCTECNRWRNGRRWHDGEAPHRERQLGAICPACQTTFGRTREPDDGEFPDD
jgi:hypothetical protein